MSVVRVDKRRDAQERKENGSIDVVIRNAKIEMIALSLFEDLSALNFAWGE